MVEEKSSECLGRGNISKVGRHALEGTAILRRLSTGEGWRTVRTYCKEWV